MMRACVSYLVPDAGTRTTRSGSAAAMAQNPSYTLR